MVHFPAFHRDDYQPANPLTVPFLLRPPQIKSAIDPGASRPAIQNMRCPATEVWCPRLLQVHVL